MAFITSDFGTNFRKLTNLYDNEKNLCHADRIYMYEELLLAITSDDLLKDLMLNDVITSLRSYCEELTSTNNYHIIYKFESIFSKWMHIPSKTIYHNPQNVHVFMNPAIDAARAIINKYPSTYTERPFEHPFFDSIETSEMINGICIRTLFASIWSYITAHKDREELIQRLKEEIDDSKDMCLSGHMIRLINTVNGYDDFQFNIDQYEYSKANIFNQLNKLIDVTTLDGFLDKLQNIVNSRAIDMSYINQNEILSILKDYSKCEWKYTNKFKYVQ
jgi:hypothetical protein